MSTNEILKHQVMLDGNVSNDNYSVNLHSGEMHYTKHLLGIKTKGSSIELGMSYRYKSKDETKINGTINTGLGKGFKFNYQQVVFLENGNYVYVDGDYKHHIFKLADNLTSSSSTKVYYDICGNYTTLEELSSGYKIVGGNETLTFDSNGRLTSISIKRTDTYTYTETISYDNSNRVTKVSNELSNIEIEYKTNEVVLTASDDRKVIITLANSSVIKVKNTIDVDTLYEYEYGKLSWIEEGSLGVEFEYSADKVSKVNETYNGVINRVQDINYFQTQTQLLSYSYSNGTTIKNLEIDQRYVFNSLGEIKSTFEVVDEKVCGVQYFEYGVYEQEVINVNSGIEEYAEAKTVNANSEGFVELYPTLEGEQVVSVSCKLNKSSNNEIGRAHV